eukprot:TRINITY_DN22159_c0_g1_i1.p1 TRINITY_DN22159_c0_g1~~TRINITY_DN22159_c0_g1_i1.p1  ORF type:complete len:187 (-),score=59.18 TRINITY_DN22159_c0_g1_i1:151-711(-)
MSFIFVLVYSLVLSDFFFFFFFSSRRRHTRCREVSWARRCVQETGTWGEQTMDELKKNLLNEVSGLHGIPVGAYNIRVDGQALSMNSTANIEIVKKTDKNGIDIYIKPNTKNESLHIPVILTQTGLKEVVYNDFHIGENSDVTIIAGCGIHNDGKEKSQHDGIHSFFVGKNAKVKYIEKHLSLIHI